jgi:hypothetical protein
MPDHKFAEVRGPRDQKPEISSNLRLLSNDDQQVKANAAHFLAWSKDKKAVELLEDLLRATES